MTRCILHINSTWRNHLGKNRKNIYEIDQVNQRITNGEIMQMFDFLIQWIGLLGNKLAGSSIDFPMKEVGGGFRGSCIFVPLKPIH